jgi:hypothetical protein
MSFRPTPIALLFLAVALVPAGRLSAQTEADKMRQAMNEWSADIGRTPAQQEAHDEEVRTANEAADAAYEAKSDAWQKCGVAAMNSPATMSKLADDLQKGMTSGKITDPGAYQAKVMNDLMEQKCGPQPKKRVAMQPSWVLRERYRTYLRVRKEKGAKAAAEAITATPEEAAALESNLTELTSLVAREDKATGVKH